MKRQVRRYEYLQTDSVLHVYARRTSRGITSINQAAAHTAEELKKRASGPFPLPKCPAPLHANLWNVSMEKNGVRSGPREEKQKTATYYQSAAILFTAYLQAVHVSKLTRAETPSIQLLAFCSIPTIFVSLPFAIAPFRPLHLYSPSLPVCSRATPVPVVPRTRCT